MALLTLPKDFPGAQKNAQNFGNFRVNIKTKFWFQFFCFKIKTFFKTDARNAFLGKSQSFRKIPEKRGKKEEKKKN